MKFFERCKAKLKSLLAEKQKADSDKSIKDDKTALGCQKKIKRQKKVSENVLKQNFLMKVRERNNCVSDKSIEDYSKRQQLVKEANNIMQQNAEVDMKCKICNYYLIYPVLLRCGHTACERCIDEYSTRQQICIQCEEPLSHSKYIISQTLQSVIERHIQTIGEKEYKTYSNTKKMRDNLRNKRFIKDFSENQLIDVRDKYFDWYEGKVKSIIYRDNAKYLVVQLSNSLQKTEIINCLSPNIAPNGYFTKRKDLQTREERKLDIVKSLVTQYEQIRTQRSQSQPEEQQQQQPQNEDQQNFHNLILRHLTSAQSLPYMISLMNGAMRRSESQQRILNTIQVNVPNNNNSNSNNNDENQQIQQEQPQQEESNQQNNQNSDINQQNPQQNIEEENREESNQNNQNQENQNQEEQMEIQIDEYENENEDDEDIDEEEILSNSDYSYQNIDAFSYVQEWE